MYTKKPFNKVGMICILGTFNLSNKKLSWDGVVTCVFHRLHPSLDDSASGFFNRMISQKLQWFYQKIGHLLKKKSTLGSDFRPNSTRNLLFCDVITHYKSNYQLMLMPFPSLHIARGRIWQPQGGERDVSCSAGTACMWDEFRAPDSNLIQTQPEPKPNQNLTRTQPKPDLNPTLLAVPAWKYQRGRSRKKTRPYPANWKINLKNLWDKERC